MSQPYFTQERLNISYGKPLYNKSVTIWLQMERYPIQGYWLLLYGVPTAFVTATVNDAMCTKYSKHKLDVVMLRPVC